MSPLGMGVLSALFCVIGFQHAVAETKAPESKAADAEVKKTDEAPAVVDGSAPADRFVEAIDADASIDAQARALIRSTWAACDGCDAAEFLAQGLTVVSKAYRAVLDAYDADAYERCAALALTLRRDAESRTTELAAFLRINAAAYQVKALVAQELTVEASALLESLFEGDEAIAFSRYSYFAPEMAFLRGYCLVSDLQYEKGADALRLFVRDYPQASLRLTVSARQMLTELLQREPDSMGEVVDLMHYSRTRLAHTDGGPVVQQRQQRILDLLDLMIKEAENQEKQSCSSSGGGGGGSKSSQGKNQSKPMQESRLPGGKMREGQRHAARRANPAEVWGTMPPADRERILQALRESFPSRYRQLVEQYYEQLAKEP